MCRKGSVVTGMLYHACLLVVAAGDGMAAGPGDLHVRPWVHLVGTAPGAGEAGDTEAMDPQEEGDDLSLRLSHARLLHMCLWSSLSR
jgi:hypothetical protein